MFACSFDSSWPFYGCFSLQLLLYPFPERWDLNRVIHWSHTRIYIRQTAEFPSWSRGCRLALPSKKGSRAQLDKSGLVLGPMINHSVCSLAPYCRPGCNFGPRVQLKSKLKAAPYLPQGCPPPNSICRNRTFLYFFWR